MFSNLLLIKALVFISCVGLNHATLPLLESGEWGKPRAAEPKETIESIERAVVVTT